MTVAELAERWLEHQTGHAQQLLDRMTNKGAAPRRVLHARAHLVIPTAEELPISSSAPAGRTRCQTVIRHLAAELVGHLDLDV